MSNLHYPYVPRRVVTGVAEGRSVFLEDGPAPNSMLYTATPGMMTSVLYMTAAAPTVGDAYVETSLPGGRLLPKPGETSLVIVTFPPDAVMMSADFDGPAAGAEHVAFAADFAARFELDNPGKHQTDTIDYDIVLDGQISLELDNETRQLHAGDVVVQRATRHAWRNTSERPATLCFVLVGAAPVAPTPTQIEGAS